MLKRCKVEDVTDIGDSTPMAVVDASNVNQMSDWH